MSTTETLAAARETLAAHEKQHTLHAAHEATVKAHAASEPKAPKGARPTPPATPRPTTADVAAASATVSAAERADGQREGARRALVVAEELESDARATRDTAAETARRIARLPDIIRKAPGRLLARQVEALPQTPHVRVTVEGESIRIEGMSTRGVWLDAADVSPGLSGGELVRAGAELRAAARGAADARYGVWGKVSIFVDERQSWSGDLDGVPLPRVEMVTLTPTAPTMAQESA